MKKNHKKRYLSIKTKLFAVIFLVLVAAITANSLIDIFTFKSAYQKALEEKSYAVGQALSRIVYNNLRYFPLDSFSQMNSYLKSILDTNEGIDYCFIADKQGKILYHADPQFVGFSVDQENLDGLYPLENLRKTTVLIKGYY
ncbi:MAG: hypothetical protein KKH93_05740 [Candidatus Omnitrophica bacterium]|nr:hypothetical protein [Candidatus Omnitrophota bacterium]